MRKTKIVCTIGPASETEQIITGLCKAGMNVARLDFSHNTHEDHQRRIDLVKKVRSDLKMPIAIMLSGETAAGKYPIESVKTIAEIAETTESNIHYNKRFHNAAFEIRNSVDAIFHSTRGMAIDLNAKAVEIDSIDSDFILSDNYFDMNAGSKTVKIVEGTPKTIRLRSVYDIK